MFRKHTAKFLLFFMVSIDFFGFLYSLMIFLFLLEVRKDSLWWCFYLCLLCLSLYVDIAGQLTVKRFFPTNFLKDFSKIIDSQPSAWDIRSSKKKPTMLGLHVKCWCSDFFMQIVFKEKKVFFFIGILMHLYSINKKNSQSKLIPFASIYVYFSRVNLENPDLTGHRVDQAPREPQDLQAIWDLWVSQLIPELRVTLVTLENQDHEDPPGVGDLQERKGRRASQDLPYVYLGD